MPNPPAHRALHASELVIGLVYGAGADAEPVERLLRHCLGAYSYQVRAVRLSRTFPTIVGEPSPSESPDKTRRLQDMGDQIREQIGTPHALAHLAVYLIADARRRLQSAEVPRTAWLLRSMRRPEEVHELRRVYGPRFVLLAVHSPEVVRQRTASAHRRRWSPVTAARFDVEAIADIRRDEEDTAVPYGQAMRPTFSLADFFIDASSTEELERTVHRTVELLFGAPFVPPTRVEQAMYIAHTAGLRSAEMGRQVGAAIPCHNCTRHIISSGIKRVHYLHPYAKSLARELHGDAVSLDPENPSQVTDKVVMTQYLGVAPRGYPQYFNFEHVDRKDGRGAAITIGDRAAVVPRPLRDKETFGFGGPALPPAYVGGIERAVAAGFRDVVRDKDNLNLPTIGVT